MKIEAVIRKSKFDEVKEVHKIEVTFMVGGMYEEGIEGITVLYI
jgi:hypothetical protein